MRFPDSPRVIYDKNPLETVICQLRFPPILRIDGEAPFEFQEKIRADYPIYKDRQLSNPGLSLPPEIMKAFGEDFSWAFKAGTKAYDFFSTDEAWNISLTREFIALSSKTYRRWEDFRGRMEKAVSAFEQIYVPAHYSRIGLRYRDIINRSRLDLKGVDWAELLAPHIAGELNSGPLAEHVSNIKKELVIELEDAKGSVLIKHGLVQKPDADEAYYLIDSDFSFVGMTEVANAGQRLNYFNREAARLFKWCISPRLYEAMGPRPVEP